MCLTGIIQRPLGGDSAIVQPHPVGIGIIGLERSSSALRVLSGLVHGAERDIPGTRRVGDVVPEQRDDGEAATDYTASDFSIPVQKKNINFSATINHIIRNIFENRGGGGIDSLPQKSGLHVDIRDVLGSHEYDLELDADDRTDGRESTEAENRSRAELAVPAHL